MLIPLYGFLKGDTIGLLVLAKDTDTVAEVAQRLQEAAEVRVPKKKNARVYFAGKELRPEMTVVQAQLNALDRIDVVGEEGA